MRAAARLACVAALIGLAGCGSSPKDPPKPKRPDADAAVIRGWADALRAGRFPAAAAFFAVPTTVANGGPPLRLRSRAEIDFFDHTLPCGAVLIATQRIGPRVIATFRLTERKGPGAGCGSGVGHQAQVSFLIRNRKIVEWLREPDPAGGAGGGNEV